MLDAFIPTEDEIYQAKIFLTTLLPLELAEEILEYAQYWAVAFIERQMDCVAKQQCGNWCYLLSPTIGHTGIRKLIFETESHDQGWGGEPVHKGTYQGSWTWFECKLLRESFGDPAPLWLERAEREPVCINTLEDVERSRTAAMEVEKNWHIQDNVTASKTRMVHRVTWDLHSSHEAPDFCTWKGRTNDGAGFLKLVQPGDRIALFARSEFPGWQNFVFRAAIEVYYSV